MVRVFLVFGQDPPEHPALKQLNWQRVKGGWLGSDGPCPWGIVEHKGCITLYNQHPANSTMLVSSHPRMTVVTNYPPCLHAFGPPIPNRHFLERWVQGDRVSSRGIQLDFLRGVFRIPWGHALRLSEKGFRVLECVRCPTPQMFEDAIGKLESLLRQGVISRLGADSQYALALSSGLDSTLLGAILRDSTSSLEAFTMESRIPGTDERSPTQESSRFLGIPLSGFNIDECSVLGESIDCSWGPQAHPGERHETEFFQFVADKGFDKVWTGIGADQLFHLEPSVVTKSTIVRPGWKAADFLKPGRGWRSLFSEEISATAFNTVEWDLAVRHQFRVQERTKVELVQPFLDPELVDFVLGLPNLFLASANCDKLLLRELGSRLIPKFPSFRRKFTDFGPSVQFRLNQETETKRTAYSPKEWRKIAARRWLDSIYGKR